MKKQQVASIPQEAEEERKRRQKCSFLKPKIISTNKLTFVVELWVFEELTKNHLGWRFRRKPEQNESEGGKKNARQNQDVVVEGNLKIQ